MKFVIFLLFLSVMSFSEPLKAQGIGADVKKTKQQKSKLQVNSAKQAAKIVRKRVGGKVLKVQNQRVNGNRSYRVKVVKPNGHVTSVSVDAKSGRVKGK